eukprot:TRINITY_DN8341_c0_g1_i1.p1 TRINITY_DN8341_c0_g1~~TRINITY_DN8341_c0_g1_i1.p1  ORF type:complete len:205 (-),score=47.51 TRINITY_DN8341_c0_g1_i1:97-711(-)
MERHRRNGAEEQLILRLPPTLADEVRKLLRSKQFNMEMEFEFDAGGRQGKFKVGKKKYDAQLLDLPCILESQKTLDKVQYYKSADIGQMLLVQDLKTAIPPPPDFKSLSGISPPVQEVRRRRWRKAPDAEMLAKIEAEIMQLLKPSENENIEVLEDVEDFDELTGEIIEETITPPKVDNKIRIRVGEGGTSCGKRMAWSKGRLT